MLFIDEIHRLNHSVEEILYPAMEDFAIDVMIGRGPSARSLRLSLKPFTVVGATTRAGRISSPLRDRFGAVHRLDYYAADGAGGDRPPLGGHPGRGHRAGGRGRLARRGRGTPRVVNRLLRRVRDHAEVRATAASRRPQADAAMTAMDIDDEGLDTTDRRLLAAIVQKFASGPVGGAAIAAVIGEEVDTIEDVYEPYLLQLGFLDRTPQGRVATERARDHLRRARLRRAAAAAGRPHRPGPVGRHDHRGTHRAARLRRVTGAAAAPPPSLRRGRAGPRDAGPGASATARAWRSTGST